jgi:hypothetical protein
MMMQVLMLEMTMVHPELLQSMTLLQQTSHELYLGLAFHLLTTMMQIPSDELEVMEKMFLLQ